MSTPQYPTFPALLLTADGSYELVILDDSDCVIEDPTPATEEDADALFAGEHPTYRIASRQIHVGDGDSFYRLELR